MRRFCIFLIQLYRKYISPLKGRATCRFYPSCSCYAVEAYEKHGFFGGSYLTFKRIVRCNPFCKGGIDKVPEKISFGRNKSTNSNMNGE